jgi:hypothetical protein
MDKKLSKEVWELYEKSEKNQEDVTLRTGQTNVLSRSKFMKSLIEYSNKKGISLKKEED